ncbi:hypothetical protein EB796_021644 [Bugula neritina]|uniref:FAM136A n=1 Tax=Bugula neritina TaxID=10212 RepID=A0A7J7J317_BUGNE|nr:hypothetical protein EB796_021644 [Bugula neritina]
MDQVHVKVQEAVDKHMDELDKACIRKMQVKMFKCSAVCCENHDLSMHQVQECVNRCNAPVMKADQHLQSEMQSFQNRLQRCALDCRDNSQDKLGANPSEKERQQASLALDKCALKCVDTHLAMLPNVFKRIKESINNSV